MKLPRAQRLAPSRAEYWSDAIVHLAGIAVVLVAVPILIVMSVSLGGDWATITAISIYGACLLAMLVCSALYNMARPGAWSGVLRRLDHSAIYLKIAGSYTPFVALSGGTATHFLAGLWTVALGGTSLKVLAPDRLRWLGLGLYLGMGWAGAVLGGEVLGALSPAATALLVTAGALYTIGVAFFLWEALPFHTTIWHVFVLAASALIYTAILLELRMLPLDAAALEAMALTAP
ncbi:hemolysin III [Tranquillimonas rosea]|uniref:Hemolysin III n=1 Tax=Tranquillimonas rosea TaxID=641238 RepID=A0A1H9W5S4_9RHOB|nr:hemolysin III family protein [Tranquillimonas rosea]SES29017.1 hemolysin III [Tranquillimonas rosea]